ncbi:MAG TPA: bifunctional ornithine acetyltransferase/N-acetylglutamate synthase [Candidatus Obscuribacterales bacterium]
MKIITGGITSPKGFLAAGAHVGLRRKRKDLAIVYSHSPCVAAGVFTANILKAAPVVWSQKVVKSEEHVKGIIINSGQANSCTGPSGAEHCDRMVAAAAKGLGCPPAQILAASTGMIGVPIPIEKAEAGMPAVIEQLSAARESGTLAAEAIMTTDSFAKEFAVQLELGGKVITIGAMAKGSGMVHPNMATMLSFITTDAAISKELLQVALGESTGLTYNMISVDGDTSTNDMVIALANGAAGNEPIEEIQCEDFHKFFTAFHAVNEHLAKQIARDGEGATKLVEVSICGTQTAEEAQKLAKSVVSSSLVKTALFGQDANWGRILAALGRGGVWFDPGRLSMHFASKAGEVALVHCGTPLPFDTAKASAVLGENEIQISIDLNAGPSSARAWGCDLTYDYVRITGTYRV